MNDLVPRAPRPDATDPTERLERFQSLEPGTYWRARAKIATQREDWPRSEVTIRKGEVLLLLDIEQFEGRPHTAVLKYHPRAGEGTHRFLIDDFLAKFDVALDGEDVRAKEVAELQKEVVSLQEELIQAQSNPALIAPTIQEGLAQWEAKERLKGPTDDAGRSAGEDSAEASSALPALMLPGGRIRTDIASAIENRVRASDMQALRRTAEREAKIAEIKAGWLTERTEQISRKLSQLTPFFAEKSAVALARTQGVRKYAEEVMKGIESLDLYVGKGVTVETLVDGDDAVFEEPLTIMQRKLLVDEELAAWADVGAQFDFESLEVFDKELARNPSLVNQLLPFPRCVVSIAVRRSDVKYNDAWSNAARNAENRRVFLLVRNGAQVHRVYSAVESHENAERLFPTKEEADGLFQGIDGRTITYRDIAFTRKAEGFERLALHYKRFLILLCGLDHRLQLFGRFYDPAEALSFISRDFQEKHFRFISDDDPSFLLGSPRPAIREWMQTQNAFLRSGSRVLCYYPSLISPEASPACEKARWSNGREYIDVLAKPRLTAETKIAYRDGNEICVDVEVERRGYGDYTQPYFNARVSLTKAERDADFPYLCLDAVKATDVEAYVFDRASRVRHIEYMRLLKTAAASLREEERLEAPARAYMRQALLDGKVATEANADDLVAESVRMWRASNRGAPLPNADDRKALEPLLNYIHSTHVRPDDLLSRVEAFATERGLKPLRVVLTGKDRLGLYAEVPEAERDERICNWRWTTRLSLKASGTKVAETSSRLAWLTQAGDAAERVLKDWPEGAPWLNAEAETIRPRNLELARKTVESAIEHAKRFAEPIDDELFAELTSGMQRLQRETGRSRTVAEVSLVVPMGAYAGGRGAERRIVYMALVTPIQRWLYRYGNAAQRAKLEEDFTSIYANKNYASDNLRGEFAPRVIAVLGPLNDMLVGNTLETFTPSILAQGTRTNYHELGPLAALRCWETAFAKVKDPNPSDLGPARLWIHPDAYSNGASPLLESLGIAEDASAKPRRRKP
jgi:hypothetical protein